MSCVVINTVILTRLNFLNRRKMFFDSASFRLLVGSFVSSIAGLFIIARVMLIRCCLSFES